MRPERMQKFEEVVNRRQFDLTIILENVHDPHNIAAILRSCDSVGICEIYVLYTESQLTPTKFELGKRSSAGARKWVDVHFFRDAAACFAKVRERGYAQIFSTHLSEQSGSLFELNLAQPVALLFGNERDGLSAEALSYSNGNFTIPQFGMTTSLNISVACAVTLYEACRQRWEKGYYGDHNPATVKAKNALLAEYIQRHEKSLTNRKPRKYEE